MTKFGTFQTVARFEDPRLLTGRGRFVDDIAPAGALHALFLRSNMAHARITGLDVTAARAVPGVHLVLTAADLTVAGVVDGMRAAILTNRDGGRAAAPRRALLAEDRVRFVGEPVVVVVAETLAAARDALERVVLETEELPVKLDLAPGGPAIHPEAPDNIAFDWSVGDEAVVMAALDASVRRVRLEVLHNRVIVNSIEPRACFAEWDGARLHVCINAQGVWVQKREIARLLKLDRDAVRVTTPDVGGGFGMKGMVYPEYPVIAHAARVLGRPVRWTGERTESMLTDNAGRDLIALADMGFDAENRITGYRVDVLSNLGACNSQYAQEIQSDLFSKVLTGCYDIPRAFLRTQGIYTNTTQVDAYRGAGRPEAIYTIERVMDQAARDLGVDPAALRRVNFISRFPYRSATGEVIDVGDFPRVLARAEAEGDVAGFAARKAASAARGLLRGLGLCCYIESILGDDYEGAKVEFNADGTVSLFVGTQSNGQGHETVYAQFLSDRTGIPVEAIRIVQGDSDRIAHGGGTGGSRSVTVQSTATIAAIEVIVAAFAPFLEQALGVQGVTFDDGAFRAAGTNRTLTLVEAADLARSQGREDLLRHQATGKLTARSYPNGAHIAEVEIDPDTGHVQVVRYTVTDDFGVLMHPKLAEGQVHGGVAQGIGQAITEHAVFDDGGQLLTASFMDYAMPRADDMPFVAFSTEPVPSTGNPLGMKGCGEAGTVGALAAVANAVRDALADRGVPAVDMPFTPLRVWEMLQSATRPGGAA
jgi:aerobic carbon-monoxide dehydrogenase large subunit